MLTHSTGEYGREAREKKEGKGRTEGGRGREERSPKGKGGRGKREVTIAFKEKALGDEGLDF